MAGWFFLPNPIRSNTQSRSLSITYSIYFSIFPSFLLSFSVFFFSLTHVKASILASQALPPSLHIVLAKGLMSSQLDVKFKDHKHLLIWVLERCWEGEASSHHIHTVSWEKRDSEYNNWMSFSCGFCTSTWIPLEYRPRYRPRYRRNS